VTRLFDLLLALSCLATTLTAPFLTALVIWGAARGHPHWPEAAFAAAAAWFCVWICIYFTRQTLRTPWKAGNP
jgi:uncharacterized membrane protein YozB (DUF420 family)